MSQKKHLLDAREPHRFLGFWKRSIPNVHDSPAVDEDYDEPHAKRRIVILESHPEIRKFYGKCSKTFPILLFSIAFHILISHYSLYMSFPVLVLSSYFIGGTICQLMGVLIHEACHDLIFSNSFLNTICLFLANIPLPVPISASFKRYHLEHHAYQGIIGKDPDLPLPFEYYLIKGSSFKKFIWLVFYPLMYVIRGASMKKTPSISEVVNLLLVLLYQIFLYRLYDWNSSFITYIWLSFYFGYSFHPAAAHFIQEHFTWKDGQETYSYYGPLNYLFLNIGLHNEHHDFTQVPWNLLPSITEKAPEFYTNLKFHSHSSWVRVFIDFIFNDDLGPQSRLVRSEEAQAKGRHMITYNRVKTKQ